MKTVLWAAALSGLLGLGGCATLVSGSSQSVSFDSSPEGAKVLVNGTPVGVTPFAVMLKRESGTVVTVKKDGYRPQSFPLKSRFNPYFWGNILVGGLIGSSIDVISGATVEYKPHHYFTTLEPLTAQSAGSDIQDKRTMVSQFIVSNYGLLGQELVKPTKAGEHVAALLALLNVPAADSRDTAIILKNLYLDPRNKTAPAFANAVLKKFGLNSSV